MMKVYNSPGATIIYDEEDKCVLQTVNSSLHSDELKSSQINLVNFCEENGAKKIIADTKHLKTVKIEDIKWLSSNVLPALSKSGVKHYAIVMPDDPFGEMAVRFLAESSSIIEMEIFGDLPAAQQWLQNVS